MMAEFTNTKESGLETLIVKYLTEHNGYEEGTNGDYNEEYAVDETRLFRFLNWFIFFRHHLLCVLVFLGCKYSFLHQRTKHQHRGLILPVSPMMGDGVAPEELTVPQIAEIVEQFARAAKRAKAAGYDGVEIHSAHAYLLNQFYSPLTNHREDEYGGDIERRLRIHREVIQSVRSVVGNEFMISLRLGGCDYSEGGSTIEDSVYASKVLADAGVDMLNITGGMCRYTRQGHDEPGYFQDMSSAVKKAVAIPVMLTGGIKTLEDAETLLKNDDADLIGVGREILKNPYWLKEQMKD